MPALAAVKALAPTLDSSVEENARSENNLIAPGRLEIPVNFIQPQPSRGLGAWRQQAMLHNSGFDLECTSNTMGWRMLEYLRDSSK